MRGSSPRVTLLLVLPIAEEALELGAHARCNVIAFEGVADIAPKKPPLRAAIEGPSFEFQSVKRLCSREFDHRVGELDFAAGAAPLRGENAEDLGLQDITAGDDEVRGRFVAGRFLDHL